MGEKNLWSKLGIIVLLVGLCAWQAWPPEQRLKPGIDLGGGHSLLFEIDDSGLETWQKTDLAERVMGILKNRVDPQGNRNLVWRPIGRSRLEIQMPKPPPAQKEYRDRYENIRDTLSATSISRSQIEAALARTAAERDAEFARMSEVVRSRKALSDQLTGAITRYDQLAATTTQPSSEQAKEMDGLLTQRGELMNKLLATNVEVAKLSDLLELGRGHPVREEGLTNIKKEHGDLAPLIDDLAARYDEYAKVKGTLDDPSDLMRLLRGAGVLEFRILAQRSSSNPEMTDSSNARYNERIDKYEKQLQERGPRPGAGDNYQWFRIAKPDDEGFSYPGYITADYTGQKYVLAHRNPDMGLIKQTPPTWALRGARRGQDDRGRGAVNFSLDTRGGKQFGVLTSNSIGRPLCIFLDNEAISAATIRSKIFSEGQISGSFTPDDVRYLINTLEAGSLPARLNEVPLQQKSVGPALGQTNRTKGIQATLIAFLLTVAFMIVYYAYAGLIADIALFMNLILTLGVMSFLQATWTLPGIAGLILTLGMAVDANVLIFERMREELQRGVSVRMAVKLGYEKAFSAILDGNVTTIITAVILASLGSEEIKGFGLTLSIGLATSMFTALFVTRQFFHVMVPATLNMDEVRKPWLGTGILALLGGAIFGLGWLLNAPQEREDSTLIGFGKFLLVMFATGAALMVLLFAFRWFYRVSGHQKAGRMPMMKLLSVPNINWMGKYKVFWALSAVVVGLGMVFWAFVDKDQYLDIEFIGGTSVQVQLREGYEHMTDEDVLAYVSGSDRRNPSHAAGWLRHAAGLLRGATVTPDGEARYRVALAPEITPTQAEALLLPSLAEHIERGGITPAEGGVAVQFNPDEAAQAAPNAEAVKNRIAAAADYAERAADKLGTARAQLIEEDIGTGTPRKAFEVITSESQRTLVAEALLAAMGGEGDKNILEVSRPIAATLVKDPGRGAPDGIYPIKQEHNTLAEVLGGDSNVSVADYKGGLVLVFDDLKPAQTAAAIYARVREMRLQPDFEGLSVRKFETAGLDWAEASPATGPATSAPASGAGQGPQEMRSPPGGERLYKRVAILVNDPALPNFDPKSAELWRTEVAEKELALAQAALASSRSLQRVTQFAPQVASEAQQKAIIALILSLIAIAGYMWVRFGAVDFGLAGIIALYHDVAVSLACVMACHHLHDTAIGRLLGLSDFRIDLSIIAALLTIVGYSINDTIVIFDRVRENRGRLATVSEALINRSLNQTLSRTILTQLTVFMVVIVMYVAGGDGIHGFAFTMIVGSISGCYSTLAIASPMINHPRAMWVTTIVLSALTGIGVVSMIPMRFVRAVLIVLIALAAAYGLVRQAGLRVPSLRREPVPA